MMDTIEKIQKAVRNIELTKPEFPKDQVIKIITCNGYEDSFYKILLNLLKLIGNTDECNATRIAEILIREFQKIVDKSFNRETLAHAIVSSYFANPRLIARALIGVRLNNKEEAV
jgi:hypothetical protein